jgi:hypothetical protein
MGYAELARKARVSKRTIQSVVGRLIEKRFISIVTNADIYHRKPAVYQVRGYVAALTIQRAEGKTWILRTGNGVFFARRLSPSTVEAGTASTVEAGTASTVERSSPSTVEDPSTTSLGIKEGKEAGSSSSSLHEVFHRNGLLLDADAERTLRKRCQAYDPSATDEEIAYFTETKITQLRKKRNVGNWVGLLITVVPELFVAPAHELKRYREGKRQEEAASRKRLTEILDDSRSTDEERQWAKAALEDPT